ncbi:hypothetical protein [Leucobacter chromiiresistens]|uniref:ATP-binding protein n=2 Tax=Leucobacter chromiiresistens TaxID=1079994 RepID=A0A1H0ZZ88_9MICO|nr:hypothetical protein [Leucobacter chromiiresistens]SDQ32703.1 hypothetical protein SAMN04488565_2196 [Leucobacter chromiiresistens]
MTHHQQVAFIPPKLSRKERRLLKELHAPTENDTTEAVEVEEAPSMSRLGRLARGHVPDLKLPRHTGTGWEWAGLNPFPFSDVPVVEGPVIGLELTSGGQPFSFQAWHMYNNDIITSPNVLFKGGIGRGKSYFMKRMVTLGTLFGVHSINTSDVKGEHGVVAAALGGQWYRVGAFGTDVRVNPFEKGERHFKETAIEHEQRIHASRQLVARQLAGLLLEDEDPLTTIEKSILAWALEEVVRETNDHPTIRKLVQKIDDAEALRTARGNRFEPGEERRLRFLFDPMLTGNLAGMFEDEGTVRFNPDSPYTVFDTYAMQKRGDLALALTQTITNSWVMNVVSNKSAGRMIQVIREEGWRDMKTLQGLEAHEMQLKLSREYGISLMMAVHEDGDFDSVGTQGSKERELAQKLLRQYAVSFTFHQGDRTRRRAVESGNLTPGEAAMLGSFSGQQGLCLLQADEQSFVIDGRATSTAWERELFDTDRAMRAREVQHEAQEVAA